MHDSRAGLTLLLSLPLQVTAMRQTITNILGTLPPQFFRVTISTAGGWRVGECGQLGGSWANN